MSELIPDPTQERRFPSVQRRSILTLVLMQLLSAGYIYILHGYARLEMIGSLDQIQVLTLLVLIGFCVTFMAGFLCLLMPRSASLIGLITGGFILLLNQVHLSSMRYMQCDKLFTDQWHRHVYIDYSPQLDPLLLLIQVMLFLTILTFCVSALIEIIHAFKTGKLKIHGGRKFQKRRVTRQRFKMPKL